MQTEQPKKQYQYIAAAIFWVVLFFGIGWYYRSTIRQFVNPRPAAAQVKITPRSAFDTEGDISTSTTSTIPQKNTTISSSTVAPSTPIINPTSTEIPTEINLDVSFSSQAPEKNWDMPWQEACEEAAVLMLEEYYAYNDSTVISVDLAKQKMLDMITWEEKQGWGPSIPAVDIVKLTKQYLPSKKATVIDNPTVEQIKKIIARGRPVLVVADGKTLPNPNYRNGGPVYHALIIRGYTADSFITNDPGTQFGENFLYKYDDLMKSIHDWNNGDVKNGVARVIYLQKG